VLLLAQANTLRQLQVARNSLWELLAEKGITAPVGEDGFVCDELDNLLLSFRNSPEKDNQFQIVETTKTICGVCKSVTVKATSRYSLYEQVVDVDAFARTGLSRLTAAAMAVEKQLECKDCGCYENTKYKVGFTFKKCVLLNKSNVEFTNSMSAYRVRERVESTDFDLVFIAVHVGGCHYVGVARGSNVNEWILYDNVRDHRLAGSLAEVADLLDGLYPNPQRELRLVHTAETFVYKVVN